MTVSQETQEELVLLKKRRILLLEKALYKKKLFELAKLIGFNDLGEFHKDLCKNIEDTETKYTRRLFLLPRGHFKTSIISNANVVRYILNNPNIRILLASSTLENAKNSLKVIKNVFWQNEEFRRIYPEFCPPEDTKEYGTQEKFTVANRTDKSLREATVEVAGVGKQITGRHYDKIVLSDIVTEENCNTPDQIKKCIQWVGYLEPILDVPEKDSIDMEGTRYHFDEIYGVWEKRAKSREKSYKDFSCYRRICFEEDKNGDKVPLFPERFTLEGLENVRIKQGSFIFASQYLLEPIDEATAPFKRDQIRYMRRAKFPNPRPPCFMAIDPAISEDQNADHSVITVATFDKFNKMYVLDVNFGHWNPSRLIDNIFSMYDRYKPFTVAIEVVSYQKMLKQVLIEKGVQRGKILPIKEMKRNSHTHKNPRIMALQPRFEQRRIIFAEDLSHDFIEQQILRYHPDKKHNKDDLLDTLSDIDEIKFLPTITQASKYMENPELRRIEWLKRTDLGEEDEYEDYNLEGGYEEDEYYANGNFYS
jgi:predicted phage terminase large subunit-like protein